MVAKNGLKAPVPAVFFNQPRARDLTQVGFANVESRAMVNTRFTKKDAITPRKKVAGCDFGPDWTG